MRRFTFLLSFAAAALGSALAAEAQATIVPIGPQCIAVGNTSTTYSATVTTNYDFYLELKVTDGQTSLSDTTDFVVNGGPSYSYRKTLNSSAWAIRQGDILDYLGIVTIAKGPNRGFKTQADWFVTVGAPGTCFLNSPADLNRWRNA